MLPLLAPPAPVTVNALRIPSPAMPGLHAVSYVPGSVSSALSSRVMPGVRFYTSLTTRPPAA